MTSLVVVFTMIVACAHERASDTTTSSNDKLATQLVAWDVVRRRAEANLLTIPLPSIAVREDPIPGGPSSTGSTASTPGSIVAIPRLSPHFASVQMAWPTICERRGVLPDDVFDYAMAWCRYDRDRTGDLEGVLAGLTSSTVPGLREAALADLINVVADAHDAVTAMRILAKLTPPSGTLEKLAALYNALGRVDDAATVRNSLPPPPQRPPPPRDCIELRAALGDFVPESLATIREVAEGSTRCSTVARSLLCRIGAVTASTSADAICERAPGSAAHDDAQMREAHYLAAYTYWGTDWFAVVDHAVKAMPEPGAEQVAIAALSASLRSGCEQRLLEEVQQRARRLLREPSHEARWTSTLQSLASITPKMCAGLQTAKSAP